MCALHSASAIVSQQAATTAAAIDALCQHTLFEMCRLCMCIRVHRYVSARPPHSISTVSFQRLERRNVTWRMLNNRSKFGFFGNNFLFLPSRIGRVSADDKTQLRFVFCSFSLFVCLLLLPCIGDERRKIRQCRRVEVFVLVAGAFAWKTTQKWMHAAAAVCCCCCWLLLLLIQTKGGRAHSNAGPLMFHVKNSETASDWHRNYEYEICSQQHS